MKFSIEELLYANEICFPDDFRRLLEKHCETDNKYMIYGLAYDYKRKYNSNLIIYIASLSRDREECIELINKVIEDLLESSGFRKK